MLKLKDNQARPKEEMKDNWVAKPSVLEHIPSGERGMDGGLCVLFVCQFISFCLNIKHLQY